MATQPVKRAYTGKDVDMLTTTATIIDAAILEKTFLTSKRANWSDPFFANVKTRINSAFSDYLGIDSAKEMRDATAVVIGILENSLKSLAEFKVQIMEDFKGNKPRRDEILTRLGFTANLENAQKHDQEALVELLFQFKKNMTAALKTEITTAGIATSLITTITGYADVLKNSNISQETLKGSRKTITTTAIVEFNEIYNTVISVAKISAKFYKGNKAMQDKFSYSKTLKGLNRVVGASEAVPPPPAV